MNKVQPNKFDEQVLSLMDYMDTVMKYGMRGMAGSSWPVIIRRWGNDQLTYEYPSTYFSNLKTTKRL